MSDFDFVDDVEFVAKPREYAKGPRGPRKRSDVQKKYDAAFENAYNTSGVLAVQIKPEDAEATRKLVNSAARLLDLATTEGEARPGKVAGMVILTFKTRVPDKRKPKTAEASTGTQTTVSPAAASEAARTPAKTTQAATKTPAKK